MKRIKNVLESNIELYFYEAHTTKNTLDVLEECQLTVDGVLFTGRSVYNAAAAVNEIYKPHNYVPFDAVSIYTLLVKFFKDNTIPRRVSSDVGDDDIVKDVLSITGIEQYLSLKYKSDYSEEDYLNFHLKNWNSNSVDVIFTSFSPIYDQLKAMGLPVFRLYTTNTAIRNAIVHLSQQIKIDQLEKMKCAVQIISLPEEQNIQSSYSAYSSSIYLQDKFLPYLKMLNGIMFQRSPKEYVIFANSGSILSVESKNKLYEILTNLGTKIFSGIGTGSNAQYAEISAYKALEHSKSRGENCTFAVHENGLVEGPILHQSYSEYSSRIIDIKAAKISEATGLSLNYVKKLQSLMIIHSTNVFTSQDLAAYMGVSERSANRILRRITEGGYGEIIGGELQSASGGRPRNITQINF